MIVSNLKNYISSAAKTVKGRLGSSVLNAVNCDQGVLNSVVSKAQYLHNSIDLATSWINMFSLLNNEIPTDVNVKVDLDADIKSDIDYAEAKILDGVDFLKQNFGNSFTISDASGLYYNLLLDEHEWTEGDHTIRSVIKTSTRNSVDDCLVYYSDGHLKFNQVIRSANFNIPDDPSFNPNTIQQKVGKYLTSIGNNFSGHISDIITDAQDHTIMDATRRLSPEASTIFAGIPDVTIMGYRGKLVLWWDVFRDYVQSSELNANLLEVIQALSNGADGLKNFMSTVAARVNNAMSCIKKFWIDLSNAFSQGGFKGVVYFIYNFFRTGATLADSNGLLTLTDNSTLVPRQYIAGMVTTLVTGVTTLISLIASYINPVIGAMVGAAGTILYGVFKSISYDSSQTQIGIQTSEKVLVPASPYALFQDEFLPSANLISLLNDYPIVLFEVPGGYMLVGPGSFNDDKTVATARCEFHPSVVQKFEDNFFDDVLEGCSFTTDQGKYHFYQHVDVLLDHSMKERIEKTWSSGNSVVDLQNVSNDRLNEYDDAIIARNLNMNVFAFTYWIAIQVYADGTHQRGTYTLYSPGMTYKGPHQMEINDIDFQTEENFIKFMLITAPYLTNDCTHTPTSSQPYTIFPNQRGVGLGAWAEIADLYSNWAKNNLSTGLLPLVIFRNDGSNQYFNDPIIVQNTFDWAIVPAKYDSTTFLTWIVVATIAVTVTAVVAVVTTFAIKKAIQNKRAEMNKAVESAWDSYGKGKISYSDYRKTVKKANRWQTIIGGTRYDYENYWNGDTSDKGDDVTSSDPSSVNTVSTVCTDLINKIYTPNESISNDQGLISLEDIKRLITGI